MKKNCTVFLLAFLLASMSAVAEDILPGVPSGTHLSAANNTGAHWYFPPVEIDHKVCVQRGDLVNLLIYLEKVNKGPRFVNLSVSEYLALKNITAALLNP